MAYKDLIKFCQTSKEYAKICDNPNTWIYLIDRDYKISWRYILARSPNANPHKYYELLYLIGLDGHSKGKPASIVEKMLKYALAQPRTYVNVFDFSFAGKYIDVTGPNFEVAALMFLFNNIIPYEHEHKYPKYNLNSYILENFDADIIDGHITSIAELTNRIIGLIGRKYAPHFVGSG